MPPSDRNFSSYDGLLGVVLTRQREARGLSLEQLGRIVGMTRQQIQKIECGKNSCSVRTLYRIACGLKISPAEALRQVDDLGGSACP